MIHDLPVNSHTFRLTQVRPRVHWPRSYPVAQLCNRRAMFRGFKVPFHFCSGFGLVKQTHHPRLRDWNQQALLSWEFKCENLQELTAGSNCPCCSCRTSSVDAENGAVPPPLTAAPRRAAIGRVAPHSARSAVLGWWPGNGALEVLGFADSYSKFLIPGTQD